MERRAILSIVIVIFYCGVAANCENQTTQGTQIPIPRLLLRESLPSCPNTTGGTQCADCNTVVFCKPNSSMAIGKYPCPKSYPYCNDGICSQNYTEECSIDGDVTCPASDGFYPDPTNCTIYYYCDENKKALMAYSCPSNYPFDIESAMCKSGPTCSNLNCVGKDFAVNPNYPRLGALCSDNKIVPGSYRLCNIGSQIDESTACKAKCTKTGNIPHESNDNMYYRCLPTGPWGSLEKTLQSCPPSLHFNSTIGICSR